MDPALHLLPVELLDRLFRLLTVKSRKALMLTCRRLWSLGRALSWTQYMVQTPIRRIPTWIVSTGKFHDLIHPDRPADARATYAEVIFLNKNEIKPNFDACRRLEQVTYHVKSTRQLDFSTLPSTVHTLSIASGSLPATRVWRLAWSKILPPTVRHLQLACDFVEAHLTHLPATVVSVKFLGTSWRPGFYPIPHTLRLLGFNFPPVGESRSGTLSEALKDYFSPLPNLVAIVAPGVERGQIRFAPNLEHFSQRSEDWERFKAMF